MSEALIIAIIGQIATLLIVFIQQIFNNKSQTQKAKIERINKYFDEKKQAYKLLISKINMPTLDNSLINMDYFDFYFQDVLLYASNEVDTLFTSFLRHYQKFIDNRKNLSQQDIYIAGKKAGQMVRHIMDEIRTELNPKIK